MCMFIKMAIEVEMQKTQCSTVQKVVNMFAMLVSATISISLQIRNTMPVKYTFNGDMCPKALAFQVRIVQYAKDVNFLKINLHNICDILFMSEFECAGLG